MRRIDEHQAGIILAKIEDLLPEDAESHSALTGQFSKLRKFRVGNYRVSYTIKEDTLLITLIQDRKDVYPSWKSLNFRFHSKSFQETSSRFFAGRHTMWDIHSSFPWIPACAGMTYTHTNPLLCHSGRSEAQTRNPGVLLQSWTSNNIWFWIWIKSGNSKSYVHRSPKGLTQR